MVYSQEVLFAAACFKIAFFFVLIAIAAQEIIRIRKANQPRFTKGPR
jgi:hypothetical protein